MWTLASFGPRASANRRPTVSRAARSHAVLVLAGAIFLYLGPRAGAVPAPIEIDIPGVGKINMSVPAGKPGAVSGTFTATKKNPDGTTMTLRQLEKSLGQDHLNWFQKVTSEGPNPPPPGVTIPFIDPPKGGLPLAVDPTWADDRPWYYDEFVPNPVPPGRVVEPSLQLSANTAGSTLKYFDQLGGQKGNTIGLSTFLISDFGNRTYDVLGTGFNWSTKINAAGVGTIQTLAKGAAFTAEFQKEIKDQFGWDRAHKPDNAQNTTWVADEKGPANATVNVQLTSNGQKILNADGSIAQYSQTVPARGNTVQFVLPRTANGKNVTDATQWTGPGRNDPGTLSFAVFNKAGIMDPEPLTDWLTANDPDGRPIAMPDFSLESDDPDNLGIFYGVNLATLGSEGQNFVDGNSLNDTFSIGSLESMLPDYVFSTTPLDYVPGEGWAGTAPDPSTLVTYDAFHDLENVPEPSGMGLILAALGAVAATRFRRRRA